MSKSSAESGTARSHIQKRRARILAGVDRPLPPSASLEALPPGGLRFLRREAEELYWNELVWEELTAEEAVVGGHLTELVFPAFLAFVDGLLLERAMPDSAEPARPRPEAVEQILAFLGERYAILTAELEAGIDSERVVWARAMTTHLIDLVLYRLYRLSPTEREQVEYGD